MALHSHLPLLWDVSRVLRTPQSCGSGRGAEAEAGPPQPLLSSPPLPCWRSWHGAGRRGWELPALLPEAPCGGVEPFPLISHAASTTAPLAEEDSPSPHPQTPYQQCLSHLQSSGGSLRGRALSPHRYRAPLNCNFGIPGADIFVYWRKEPAPELLWE